MFYLTMAILTALTIAIGCAIYTRNKNPEPIEYFAMAMMGILGGILWPLALVVLAMGGVFWIVRDFMKKPKVQIPEETGDSE